MRFKSTSKKLAASVLLLAASTGLAFAGDSPKPRDSKCESPCCPPPANLMDGFYLGVDTGYNALTADANISEFTRLGIRGNHHFASTGWNIGLFGGVGKYFNVLYLGAEAWANWSNASQRFTASSPRGYAYTNLRSNWSGGIGIVPGIALNCASLAYVRLGYEWANLDLTRNLHINATRTNIAGSDSNNRNGFAFGMGLESQILCNWSVRGDFAYIYYGNNSSNRGSRIRPIDNRWTVGVVYHFC